MSDMRSLGAYEGDGGALVVDMVAVPEFGSKTVDLYRASSCLGCRASAVYGLVSPESAVVADCSRGSDELI